MFKTGFPPIHPGEFLREALHELGLSQAQFARAIGISPMRVSHVVNGMRPVTAEMALLFGKALGQSPQFWLNLQAAYDLKTAEAAIGKQLRAVTGLVEASAVGGIGSLHITFTLRMDGARKRVIFARDMHRKERNL